MLVPRRPRPRLLPLCAPQKFGDPSVLPPPVLLRSDCRSIVRCQGQVRCEGQALMCGSRRRKRTLALRSGSSLAARLGVAAFIPHFGARKWLLTRKGIGPAIILTAHVVHMTGWKAAPVLESRADPSWGQYTIDAHMSSCVRYDTR